MSPRPLYLAPLRTEAFALRRGSSRAEVQRIGMGPVRATAARTRLARLAPGRPLLLFGFAGALADHLPAGTLVVASSCAGLEEAAPLALPVASLVARALEERGVPAVLGPVVSTPRILSGREERRRAGAGGALVVDMESRWCAPLAAAHPFAVIRAVVDVPGRDVLSFTTPAATWRAFRALSAAAGALESWSPPPAAGSAPEHVYPREDNCKVGDR